MSEEKVVVSMAQLDVLKQLVPERWLSVSVHARVVNELLEKGLVEAELDSDRLLITEAGERAKTEHILIGSAEYARMLKARQEAITAAEAPPVKSLPGYGDDLPDDLKEALKPAVRPFGANGAAAHPVEPKATLAMIDEPGLDEKPTSTLAELVDEIEQREDPRPPIIDIPEIDEDDEPEDWEVDIDLPIPFVPVRKRVEYDCGPGCVHEHVLVLLREMFPEVREAAEILRRAKEVERRLGL